MVLKFVSLQILLTLCLNTVFAGQPIYESFKVLGRGITDDETGDILQIACVDKDGNPSKDSDCKLARYATTDRNGKTFFHGPPEDPFYVEKRPNQLGSNNWGINTFPFSERFYVNLKAIERADKFGSKDFKHDPHRNMSHFLKFSEAFAAGNALDVRNREHWQFKQKRISHEIYQDIVRSSLLDDDGVSPSKKRSCAYRSIDLTNAETKHDVERWRHNPLLMKYESNSKFSTILEGTSDDTGAFMKNYLEDHSVLPGLSKKFIEYPEKVGGYLYINHPEKIILPLTTYAWYRMRAEIVLNSLLRKKIRLSPNDPDALSLKVSEVDTYPNFLRGDGKSVCFEFEFTDRNRKVWKKESCWKGNIRYLEPKRQGFKRFLNELPTCTEIEKAGLAL